MPETVSAAEIPRVAVYLDFDNIVISRYDQVHGRSSFQKDRSRGLEKDKLTKATVDIGAIIDFASSFGTLVLTRAYADWSADVNAEYQSQLVGRAVDLVQDAYLKAYAYAKDTDIDDMRAFLYRTLRNLIIDEYRRKKPVSLDAMAEESEETSAEAFLPADLTNTLEAATERLDARAALAAVKDLSPSYAEAILLRFVDGLSPAEIGERLGISENLASVRVHRALATLRTRLADHPS